MGHGIRSLGRRARFMHELSEPVSQQSHVQWLVLVASANHTWVTKVPTRSIKLPVFFQPAANPTVVFIVDVKANKHQIKQAVKKLYDIDVAKATP
ncbi:60S ribosomal protein L23a [Myotis davidii]|uniref:60S ribosomal protein L23a n=1 Tax=Myotis davidii TaxID=225400 RepID=L5M5I1_MYODS|nr:60S ribosomal protein L23a [Myotis davidii]